MSVQVPALLPYTTLFRSCSGHHESRWTDQGEEGICTQPHPQLCQSECLYRYLKGSKHHRKGCNARAIMRADGQIEVKKEYAHNHIPNYAKVTVSTVTCTAPITTRSFANLGPS